MTDIRTLAASKAKDIPSYPTGLSMVAVGLKAKDMAVRPLSDEPAWDRRYLSEAQPATTLKMSDFGYGDAEVNEWEGFSDDVGLAGPLYVLNSEGARVLHDICMRLEEQSLSSEFIISRRLRGAQRYSKFIHDMVYDRQFLLRLSRIAGVPLIPHPIRNASVQVNYYDAPPSEAPESAKLAKWHLDGMDYVFNMQLSPNEDFGGGEFLYFKEHPSRFKEDARDLRDRIHVAPFRGPGDTIFIRGSKIYHAAPPVDHGRRISIIFSMFAPNFAKHDPNGFWHVAGDDGVWSTLKSWGRFKLRTNPLHHFRDAGIQRITFADLINEGAK